MAESWEPANELEQQLLDAMQRGDQDRYFQVLGGTDLLLPLPVDDNGAPTGGWATWQYEGRTYLLAFTSQQAMGTALAQHAGQSRTARLTDIAATWPDPSWWLAIDFGLPIAGYLPENFVSQITGVSAGGGGQQIAASPAPPPAEAAAADAGGSAWAPADQQAAQGQQAPAEQGQQAPYGQEQAPYGQSAAEQVGAAGGSEQAGSASNSFEPANDYERALLAAAVASDRKAFMDALLAAYTLIPVPATATPQSVSDPAFPWPRVDQEGHTQVPVFTSLERMRERVGDSGYTVAPFVHVVEAWPDRSLWLTLNPDTPIGATLDGSRIFELADWTRQTHLAERLGVQDGGPAATADTAAPATWAPAATSAPGPSPATTAPESPAPTVPEASASGSGPEGQAPGATAAAQPSAVPESSAVPEPSAVPESSPVPTGAGTGSEPGGEEARASAEPVSGSPAGHADAGDASPRGDEHVTPGEPATDDPTSTDSGSVDSASADKAYPAAAGDAGSSATGGASPSEHAGSAPDEPSEAGIAQRAVASAAVPSSPPAPDAPAAGDEHPEWPPVPAPGGEPSPVPGPVPDLTFPADLQKPLPDEQVAYYLERHFDRVGGHVHRVADGPVRADDLRTASALGGEPGVPVHAIRWHVESARLLPLLGATRAEPAPDLVEYRIATTRLPHGAELYRIGTDGTTNVLAIFNADQHRWHLL